MTDSPSTEALNPAAPTTEAGRDLIREHGHKFKSVAHFTKHIIAIEQEAAAQTATAVEALRAFDRSNPWERTSGEGLVTTIYDPWSCYACSAMVELEGYDEPAPEVGGHYADCGWVKVRAVLSDLSAASANHDAEVAERARLQGAEEAKSLMRSILHHENTCGGGCPCGPNGEMLLCGFPRGHDGDHAWASLPTFTALTTQEADGAGEGS